MRALGKLFEAEHAMELEAKRGGEAQDASKPALQINSADLNEVLKSKRKLVEQSERRHLLRAVVLEDGREIVLSSSSCRFQGFFFRRSALRFGRGGHELFAGFLALYLWVQMTKMRMTG